MHLKKSSEQRLILSEKKYTGDVQTTPADTCSGEGNWSERNAKINTEWDENYLVCTASGYSCPWDATTEHSSYGLTTEKRQGQTHTHTPQPEKKIVLQLERECDFKWGLDTEQDTDSTLT